MALPQEFVCLPVSLARQNRWRCFIEFAHAIRPVNAGSSRSSGRPAQPRLNLKRLPCLGDSQPRESQFLHAHTGRGFLKTRCTAFPGLAYTNLGNSRKTEQFLQILATTFYYKSGRESLPLNCLPISCGVVVS